MLADSGTPLEAAAAAAVDDGVQGKNDGRNGHGADIGTRVAAGPARSKIDRGSYIQGMRATRTESS